MRRVRTLPALAALVLALSTLSACSEMPTGPAASQESLANTEVQGFGNATADSTEAARATEVQGFGNVEVQGFGNVEVQGFGN